MVHVYDSIHVCFNMLAVVKRVLVGDLLFTNSHVSISVVFSLENFVTFGALVGILIVGFVYVIFQLVIIFELFWASMTFEWFAGTMRFHMAPV